MKNTQILVVGYFVVLLIELLLQASGWINAEVFIKPLLMPILIIYLKLNSTQWGKNQFWLLGALLFSWIGDILLLEKVNIFIGGLGAFLMAHICYILAFHQQWKGAILTKKPYLALPFLLLGASMIWLIYPNLNNLLPPVVIYTSAIVLMGMTALNRKNFVSLRSFVWVFSGAMLFIISDSFIALTRFYTPIAYSGVWIMLFYGIAQFLIVEGSEK